MTPSPLHIKLEIVLDNDNKSLKYFPSDRIEGKIFLTANRNYSLRNFRLVWTGRIQVQPIQSNKEFYTYFKESWKLGPNLKKSPTKVQKGSNQVPFYFTNLILASEQQVQEPNVELQKNKPLGLTFVVHVPNDRPLPSCTEIGVLSPNRIVYLLEAYVHESQSKFFTQKTVPVFEPIYTRIPEMTIPQRVEQVFMVSLSSDEKKEFTSAMRVTLPYQGSQPGTTIPVSIFIWNNMEFTRKQGISISLFRINQVIANGRAYTSQGEKIHRVVTDLNIKSEHNDQKVQTVRIGIPIPKGTMPTIKFEQSQLLSISYYIRVQVFAQEGIYTTSEGKKSQFMMIDLPFVIGTLSTPTSSSSSPSTMSIHSPKSLSSNIISSPPMSPLLLPEQVNNQTSFDMNNKRRGNNTTSTLIEESFNRSSISSIFRKSSTSSNSTSSDTSNSKKKKNIFSTLRLYRGTKNVYSPQQQQQSSISAQLTVAQATDTNQSVKISPAVVMMPAIKSNKLGQELIEEGIFDKLTNNDTKSEADEKEEKDQCDRFLERESQISNTVMTRKKQEQQARFNMFPDEDDDEEEEEVNQDKFSDEQVAETDNNGNESSNTFNLFDDDDDDDDDDEKDQVVHCFTEQTADFVVDERIKPHHEQSIINDSNSQSDNSYNLLGDLVRKKKLAIKSK